MIEKSIEEIIAIFEEELKKIENKIKSEDGYQDILLKILSEIKKNEKKLVFDITAKYVFDLGHIIKDIFGEDVLEKFLSKCYDILNRHQNILNYLREVIYYIFDYSYKSEYVKEKIKNKILNKLEEEIFRLDKIPKYLEEKYYIIYDVLNKKTSNSEKRKFDELFTIPYK